MDKISLFNTKFIVSQNQLLFKKNQFTSTKITLKFSNVEDLSQGQLFSTTKWTVVLPLATTQINQCPLNKK